MVDILALVLHHDEQAVLVAVEMALSEGGPHKDPCAEPHAPVDRQENDGRAEHHYAAGPCSEP